MKRVSQIFAILCLVVSLFPFPLFAEESITPFPDITFETDYIGSIQYAKENSIVQGNPDGTFAPERPITRQEFAKILVESSTDNSLFTPFTEEKCFQDLTDEWSYQYICYAKDKNIIRGYNDGLFHPLDTITFIEATKIILKTFGYTFDESQADWYKTYLKQMEDLRMIPITLDTPDKKITRSEMTELILRIREQSEDFDTLNYNSDTHRFEQKIEYFKSCDVLDERIKNTQYYYPQPLMAMADNETGVAEQKSSDYSTTNVQVQGVDEGDIVKNNDRYIYTLQNNTLYVVDTLNINTPTTISFENTFFAREMFLDQNFLIVLGSYQDAINVPYDQMTKMMAFPSSSQEIAKIYSLNEAMTPHLEREVSVSGNSIGTRKIGNYLYMITSNYIYPDMGTSIETMLPKLSDTKGGETNKKQISCTDIIDTNHFGGGSFTTITAIALDSDDMPSQAIFSGSAYGNIYVSQSTIYLTETFYPHIFYNDIAFEQPVMEDIKTKVHKISLDKNNIKYVAQGYIPGTILNQFSMDEHNGFFRVATTRGQWWGEESYNNVYTFDKDMHKAGRITDIAPGERIYSTRFMGDRAYMVTFKNVDPLFVIDVADNYNPKILGELKIPGFSNYLHPYDENHIIGFGKETYTDEHGTLLTDGMKLSLFDVTDVFHPQEMYSEVIGDRGTDSPVLYDHKALLFNKKNNLLSFPIQVFASTSNQESWDYGTPIFQGAYVYTIDLQNGFDLRGKPTHYGENDAFYDYNKDIQRIIYIGDTLYTISAGMIGSYDISTLEKKGMIQL